MIEGPEGRHLCLIHPPMHMTTRELQGQNHSRKLNKRLLNWILHNLLQALSFLHEEAGVVYTGKFLSSYTANRAYRSNRY